MSDETPPEITHDHRRSATGRQLFVTFLAVILLGTLGGWYLDRQVSAQEASTRQQEATVRQIQAFRKATTLNCIANQKNTQGFNAFIGTLQGIVLGTPNLTKADKHLRITFYQAAKQPIPVCPRPVDKDKPKTFPPPPPPTKAIKSP